MYWILTLILVFSTSAAFSEESVEQMRAEFAMEQQKEKTSLFSPEFAKRLNQEFQKSNEREAMKREIQEQRQFEMQKAAFENSRNNRTITTNCHNDGFGNTNCSSY